MYKAGQGSKAAGVTKAAHAAHTAIGAAGAFVILVTLVVLGAASLVPATALAADTAPPQVTAFSITPATIDTTLAPATLTITLAITDDQSGVASLELDMLPHPKKSNQAVVCYPQRVSGNSLNGVYSATITLPRGAQDGTWQVSALTIYDGAGNVASPKLHDLEAAFGKGSAEIENTAGAADAAAPQITAFSLSPATIDTGAGPQQVIVTMTLTDDVAGIATTGDMGWGTSKVQFQLRPETGSQVIACAPARVSGTDLDGVYQATMTLPGGAQSGAWKVDALVLADKVDNTVQLGAADLDGAFGAGAAQITNTAAVSDVAPPHITAMSVSPAAVDTSTGPRPVTLTMSLTDDLAGVATWNDLVWGFDCEVTLSAAIGTQTLTGLPARVQGTDRDGVYTASLTLPKGAKEGLWVVDGLTLCDKVNNIADLFTGDLLAAVPDAGYFVANDAAAAQVTVERDWALATDHSSISLPAGVVVSRAGGGTYSFSKLDATEIAPGAGLPTKGLAGKPVSCLRIGIPGLDLSFSRPVPVSLDLGARYDGYQVTIQSLLETAAAWTSEAAPAISDDGCSFSVDHSARFAVVIAKPVFTKLSPAKGKRGATVTITGTGFGAKRGRGFVKFGTAKCVKYVSWTATRIRCVVPARAKLGRVNVGVVTPFGAGALRVFTVKK